MKDLIEIFWSFFKMGAVTFGGGYAMFPILQREIVEKKNWVSNEKIIDYYAISQGLPGIIAVNVAVFIGCDKKKLPGGVAAALGVVSPCIVIITFIAAFLSNFQDNMFVKHAFAGIAVCVAALILDAVMGLWKKGVRNNLGIILFASVFLGMQLTDISPIVFVVVAAGIGIIMGRKGGK
jgi:chromate transporter